jgi:HK97 family phage prohead protease
MPAPDRGVRFAGYAAVFDRLDQGGDIVRAGAFQRTLGAGFTIPLLWQHSPNRVIGKIHQIKEDARGLRVIGSLNGSECGALAAQMVCSRRVTGLSFGYRVRSSERAGATRLLTDVDLVEVSIVARPMQPKARIHAVQAD